MDLKKMTVPRLRELAKKLLGPGQSRLKTKTDLVAALERAEGTAARPAAKAKTAAKGAAKAKPAGAAAKAKAKPARAAKAATGKAAKPGVVKRVGTAAAAAAEGIARAPGGRKRGKAQGGPDPEGYFVARVRGEDAVRDAPHPMTETTGAGEEEFHGFAEAEGAAVHEEALGELPWGYGDDAFVALPRDPRTLFLYWDLAQETAARAFAGLEGGRVELWIFAKAGEGWERVRMVGFALESRGFYVHDLEPGRVYRAEIHAVDRRGQDRLVVNPSNEIGLPPVGPSPIVDDRFLRLPWEVPLGALLGPGRPGGAFPEEARALLARLSDWGRFDGKTWGVGSAGGMGGRPAEAEAAGRPWSPSGGGR